MVQEAEGGRALCRGCVWSGVGMRGLRPRSGSGRCRGGRRGGGRG